MKAYGYSIVQYNYVKNGVLQSIKGFKSFYGSSLRQYALPL